MSPADPPSGHTAPLRATFGPPRPIPRPFAQQPPSRPGTSIASRSSRPPPRVFSHFVPPPGALSGCHQRVWQAWRRLVRVRLSGNSGPRSIPALLAAARPPGLITLHIWFGSSLPICAQASRYERTTSAQRKLVRSLGTRQARSRVLIGRFETFDIIVLFIVASASMGIPCAVLRAAGGCAGHVARRVVR